MKRVILIFCLLIMPHTAMAKKNKTIPVKVYFLDQEVAENRNGITTIAVTRTIPITKQVAKAALDELQKGPTKEEEKKYGVSSIFPSKSAIIKSVKIKNNSAYVNFDKALWYDGNFTTSCMSGALISEIYDTLVQFPDIKHVYFAIERIPWNFYEHIQSSCPDEVKICDEVNENF